MKTLSLFFLGHLGLCMILHGQAATFSDSEAVKKEPSTPESENLLGQGNGNNNWMLVHASGMTITESQQFDTQSTTDTGARFDIDKKDKNLSENLKNDEALQSRTNYEDPPDSNSYSFTI